MALYDNIHEYFQDLYPLDQFNLDLIRKRISGAATILELGCGSGQYISELSYYYKVIGIDNNKKMIKRAKDGKGRFIEDDMLNIDRYFENKSLNLIYSFNNSLANLNSYKDLKRLFKKIEKLLKDDGVIIIEIFNENLIIKNKNYYNFQKRVGDLIYSLRYSKNKDYLVLDSELSIKNRNYNDKTKLLIINEKIIKELSNCMILEKINHNMNNIYLLKKALK